MNKSKDKPEISNAEFEVLDVLWEDHPATSNEVIARLNNKKNWHEKTVKTLLGRLVTVSYTHLTLPTNREV